MRLWRALLMVVCGLALSVTAACTTSTSGTPVSMRPNIVFVLTDDLSTNLVPYMPHVLAMQKAGTSFSHYFVTDSLCCPSRASIFTGEFPHNTGVFTNAGPDGGYSAYVKNGDERKSFALTLQKAGYRTALFGKYLNDYDPDKDPPAPGWDDWAVAGKAYAEFDYDLNENGKAHHYGSSPSDYMTDVLSQKAVDFIDSSTGSGQPFMMEVATFAPHNPYVPAPRFAEADPNVRLPRTPAFGVLPTNPPSWLAARSPLGSKNGAMFDRVFRQRVRADLATDDLIARLQAELVRRGVAGRTYFVFNSDNGYHTGEYRLHPGKMTAFDTDIRVPLVVTGPGVPAGRVVDRMVSNIDLAPTFEEIAGQQPPATSDGVSMLDLWTGNSPALWQQAVLVEHHRYLGKGDPDSQPTSSGDPPDYQAVRTPHDLLVRYSSGELEYYDLTKDPYELHNEPDSAPAALTNTLNALVRCAGVTACQHAAA